MSWAEIKKSINQNLDTPLSDLSNMEDVAIFGEQSSAYRDKDVMEQLFNNKQVPNHMVVNQYVFDFGVENNLHIGNFLKKIYDVSKEVDWNNVTDLDSLGSNGNALSALVDSKIASELISSCIPLQTLVVNSNNEVTIRSLTNNSRLMTNILNNTDYVTTLSENEVALPILLSMDTTSNIIRSKGIVYDILWRGNDEDKVCRVLCVITGIDPERYQTLEEVQSSGEILVNVLKNYTYLFNDRTDLVTLVKECNGNAKNSILEDEKALSKYIVFLLKGVNNNFNTDFYNEIWDTINMNNSVISSTTTDTPLKYMIANQPSILQANLSNSDLVIKELLDSYGSSSVLSNYISNNYIQQFAFQNTRFMEILFENKPTLQYLLTNNNFVNYMFSNTLSRDYFVEHIDEDTLYNMENVICAYVCNLMSITRYYTVATVFSNNYSTMQERAKNSSYKEAFRVMAKSKKFMDFLFNNDNYNYYNIYQYSLTQGLMVEVYDNEVALNSMYSYTNYLDRNLGWFLSAKMGLDSVYYISNMGHSNYVATVFGTENNTKVFFENEKAVNYLNSGSVSLEYIINILNRTYPQKYVTTSGSYANKEYTTGNGNLNLAYIQKTVYGGYTTSSSYNTYSQFIANYYSTLFNSAKSSYAVSSEGIMRTVASNATYCNYVTNNYYSYMMPKIVNSDTALKALGTNVNFFQYAFNVNGSKSASYITGSDKAMKFVYNNEFAISEYIQYIYGTRSYATLAETITNFGVAVSTNTSVLVNAIYKSEVALARLITQLAVGSQTASLGGISIANANKIFANTSARNILLNSDFGSKLINYPNLYLSYLSYTVDSETQHTSIDSLYNASLDELLADEGIYKNICDNESLYSVIRGNVKYLGKFVAKKLGLTTNNYDSIQTMILDEEISSLIFNNEETLNIVTTNKGVVIGSNINVLAVILSKLSNTTWSTNIDDVYDNIEDLTPYGDYIKFIDSAMIKCLVHMLGFDSRNYDTIDSIKEYGIENKILENQSTYVMMMLNDNVKNEIIDGKEEVLLDKLKEKYGVSHKSFDQLIRSISFINKLSEEDLVTIFGLKKTEIMNSTEILNVLLSTPKFILSYARNYKSFGEDFIKKAMTYTSNIKPILDNTKYFRKQTSFVISGAGTRKSFGGDIAGIVHAYIPENSWHSGTCYVYGPSGTSIYSSDGDNIGKIFTPNCEGQSHYAYHEGYVNNEPGSWTTSADVNVTVYVPVDSVEE